MYSVIDIGSNTIRLVVYRVDAEGITAILNNKYTAGLAAYIGKDGALSDEGIERLVDEHRQRYLLSRMEHRQTIVTACDTAAFARTDGRIYRMHGGVLTEA